MRKSHRSHGRRRLPPLTAACAFEACARHGSTVAAAAELGVTHGAVSKQVALLERWLEVALFDRTGGRLTPTSAGARYAATLGRALDQIDAATRDAAAADAGTAVVRVSTTASFAALWLLPRLPAFRAHHPGIEIWVSETRAAVDVGEARGADVALRTGRGPWPGVRAEALMSDHLIPVCAPPLAPRLRVPADLARATLLHDEDPRAAWPIWLDAAGLGRPAWGERGPRIADGALLLLAAADGHGVALARARLAAVYLRDRRLVQPFGPAVPLGPAYWLVLPARGTPLPRAVRTFASWVREAARKQ
ncbi:MAG TPA: LysR substrate-binding domain-containing protein [Haliangiales bacterium]|nr:LysR substrate-binding domain-containing protein [Haliangiales bacterium]